MVRQAGNDVNYVGGNVGRTMRNTQAVTANPGYRAVSAFPSLDGDRPVVEVTLLGAGGWKVVSERLD
jgi:hypothetical protein